MDDRLHELLQFGQGNPFLGAADEPNEADPVLDEFFAQIELIKGDIRIMRGNVIELKQDYADILDQVRRSALCVWP